MRILLTLFIVFTLFNTNAQTMVDTGKVWNVAGCMNFGPCGTTNYYFSGDTTVGLHQYKLLVVDNDSGWIPPPEPLALREDTLTKQIFFLEPTGESLVYDFSLTQGASYTTAIFGCSMSITVDSVDTITLINGEIRKRMIVTITSLSCFGTSYMETWIEGVGSLMGLTKAGYNTYAADIFPELICFHENDTMKYHNTNYSSCFFTTIGINEISSRGNFTITPNPTSDFISIHSNIATRFKEVIIKNVFGQTILRTDKTEIDLSQVATGIYFVEVMTDVGNFEAKVLRK